MNRAVAFLMFVIGWTSGGGVIAALVAGLLEWRHLMPPNDSFVVGCLWGTFGTLIGILMACRYSTVATPRQKPRPHP